MATCRNCGEKRIYSSNNFCRKCDQVLFPNKNLEDAVREKLGKPKGPLTKGVIRELTELSLPPGFVGVEIKDFRGLDAAVNLTELHLSNNRISNVNPLVLMRGLLTTPLSS